VDAPSLSHPLLDLAIVDPGKPGNLVAANISRSHMALIGAAALME
jgi:hypothetical protein